MRAPFLAIAGSLYVWMTAGLWGKDGSGSDDVPLNDVIVIQPPANRWDKNDKPAQWAYDFHTNITNIIISYFEK